MYCTRCSNELQENARFCQICGQQTDRKPVSEIEHDLRFVLPMGTPIIAVIAGYLGLVSVLIFPAPIALITGILGLRQIKRSDRSYGKTRCWVGIILGGIFTVLLIWIIVVIIIA